MHFFVPRHCPQAVARKPNYRAGFAQFFVKFVRAGQKFVGERIDLGDRIADLGVVTASMLKSCFARLLVKKSRKNTRCYPRGGGDPFGHCLTTRDPRLRGDDTAKTAMMPSLV